MAYEGMKAIL